MRRDAANDISDSEKNALIAHNKSTISKLLSINYPDITFRYNGS
ncbi:hypothetical protein PROSTU_03901 [Providencia stuartii ATCC 25827]|uniref:Uncharacterized protein n=1 Tax=Providencia stuartii ATCC 25827 TaxID=471874 RepID=A0AA87CPM0_PROST|nr:hypothetical protein PROSTU_03901 [Providencia stuartii ATCC 25827]